MNLKKLILEHYGDTDDILFADGLDDAIIGFEPNAWKVVYSRNECIKVMIKDGMDDEEIERMIQQHMMDHSPLEGIADSVIGDIVSRQVSLTVFRCTELSVCCMVLFIQQVFCPTPYLKFRWAQVHHLNISMPSAAPSLGRKNS